MKIIRQFQAVLVFLGFGTVMFWVVSQRNLHHHANNIDFVQYYSAAELLSAGENFYQPSKMAVAQLEHGRQAATPFMYWGAPWGAVVFIPLTAFSLETALPLWRLANILLLLFASTLIADALAAPERRLILLLGAGFIFFPVMSLLTSGQISGVAAFAAALLLWSLHTKRDFSAGVALALLSLKPHLMFIPAALVLVHAIKQRQWLLFQSFLFTLAMLFGAAELCLPGITATWAQILTGNYPAGAETLGQWKTATLASALRGALPGLPAWPLVALPCTALVVALAWFRSRSLDWTRDFSLLSALSIISSPYGWIFDSVVLLPAHLEIVNQLLQTQRRVWLGLYFAAQLAITALSSLGLIRYHHHYFWFPIYLLLVLLGVRNALAEKPAQA